MAIITEPATIYKTSSGRRFLTKRAAFKHEALSRLKTKSRHEPQDSYTEWRDGEPYVDLPMHSQEQAERFAKIESRYWRRFRRRVA